jgi:hypothetical protein
LWISCESSSRRPPSANWSKPIAIESVRLAISACYDFDFAKPMARRRDGAQYLFNDYDLYSVGENHRQRMKEAIDAADAETIRSGDVEH